MKIYGVTVIVNYFMFFYVMILKCKALQSYTCVYK